MGLRGAAATRRTVDVPPPGRVAESVSDTGEDGGYAEVAVGAGGRAVVAWNRYTTAGVENGVSAAFSTR